MDKRKNPRLTPGYHITASWGWMNDPCGPGYDPKTKTYHLFYQWNPEGCEWGNMSWGHVTSSDLLRWRRTGAQPSLKPDQPYDKEGVFTGCFYPTGLHGESNELTVLYSSICNLPFSWETPPYPRGSAGIAAATSTDGGRTWKKISQNPILTEEPTGISVTGYRDPYVSGWDSLDAVLGNKNSLYAVVGGGIQDKGPAIFLYEVDPQNLSKWTYKGTLFQTPAGFRPSRAWNGDAGVNWECPSFATLKHDTTSREFLIFGTEGGAERDHVRSSKEVTAPQRIPRWCMWVSGILSKRSSGEHNFEYKFGGILDHGCFYAASIFQDPKHDRKVVWGWIIEEDVTIERCRAKGWTGCLAMPRELSLLEYRNVARTSKTPIQDLASFEIDKDSEDGVVLRTLGIKPLTTIVGLRSGKHKTAKCPVKLSADALSASLFCCNIPKWEVQVSVDVGNCAKVGLRITHGKGGDTWTEIFFSPQTEQIVVVRPQQLLKSQKMSTNNPTKIASSEMIVNNREERGAHTLLTFNEPKDQTTHVEKKEQLELRVFRDGQVLEVFANDRFALATMIYVDNEDDGVNDQIHCFSEGLTDANGSTVTKAQLWEMADCIIEDESSQNPKTKPPVHSSL